MPIKPLNFLFVSKQKPPKQTYLAATSKGQTQKMVCSDNSGQAPTKPHDIKQRRTAVATPKKSLLAKPNLNADANKSKNQNISACRIDCLMSTTPHLNPEPLVQDQEIPTGVLVELGNCFRPVKSTHSVVNIHRHEQ